MKCDLDIVMVIPGLPFQGDTIQHKSLGGSETAGLCVARELAKLGHHVTVLSGCEKPGIYDRVQYLNISIWREFCSMNPHDVTIVQRWSEAFINKTASKLNVLWQHDLALARSEPQFRGVLWNVDKIAVVSDYMRKQYHDVYRGIPDSLYWTMRNGIDLEMFKPHVSKQRDRRKLICAARPERGIDVLVKEIFPKILAQEPEATLYLCNYENQVPHLQVFYDEISRFANSMNGRVVWLGHLKKEDLYDHYATAGIYAYPTPSPTAPQFAEVSCISAMEAMASGLPIMSSKRGALPETIGGTAGILIDGDPSSRTYQDEFAFEAVRLMRDELSWRRASDAGRDRAKVLDWASVAAEWSENMIQAIEEKNADAHRLAYHFIRRSDIMAAKELLADKTDEHAKEIKAGIERHWPFVSGQDAVEEQYDKIGSTTTDVYDQSRNEPRYQMLRDWLRSKPELGRILDFGCAHGGYSINLANEVGRKWIGIDISEKTLSFARKWNADRGRDPSAVEFIRGDQNIDLSDREPFDCLIMFEVLEHVTNPEETISKMERWVKPGGTVFLTVPYGPWEYMSYDTYPHRAHIWEFDMHDLRDMFKGKEGVQISTMPNGFCEDLAEPIGWHVIEYKANPEKATGKIDMARKLRIQAPRHTVSASIMAGEGVEETLLWTLKSLKHVCDEIVIADNGMSPLAQAMADNFGVRRIKTESPAVVGFETPRNLTLPHCRMDWVLWIDTDERLVNAPFVQKYLRENMFDGYSIRQHHFACDTTFKPDMPVRLFRRRPTNGKSRRWFGMIHEHPEMELNEGPGSTVILSDIHIAHIGYLSEGIRRHRFQRNYPLLQADIAKYPDRFLQKHFIMRDNMLLCMYDLQNNGGAVTDGIKERCRETIELYRKYFLGKGGFMNVDSLEYYSQALQILGEGFELAYQFKADKNQALINGDPPRKARFASIEEAQKEIGLRVAEAVGNYTSPWW